MKPKIQKLSDSVINQIAAGEVVENPASIVKELVENSLDAGSKRISIDFSHGGCEWLKVEDDGCGMSPEDALLCLQRHATSKLQKVEDLQELFTMGFRGEALAAISSICHFELRTSDGNTATKISSQGGKVLSVEPCARNPGTTIEVKSLFYNVPARKKFQKSPGWNAASIHRIVQTLAMANDSVSFFLNGKGVCLEEILASFEHKVAGNEIHGWVCSPSNAGSKRTSQFLFVNRRPIVSSLVSKAVKTGFGTRIAESEYPRFILFLEMDPSEVDVNVHPQKKEVRFKDETKVFRLVEKAVEKALSAHPFFSEEVFLTPTSFSFSESFPTSAFKTEQNEFDLIFQEHPLGVFGSYLLLQKENWVLVDLKAAHSRILFESFKMDKTFVQTLAWPIEIKLSLEEIEKAKRLSELGIEMRILDRLLVIDALPPFLDPEHFPEFFQHFKEEKRIEQLASRFCRASKKQYLMQEALALWNRVKKCQDSFYDPLGNRIFVEVKQEDLAKLFL